MNIVVRSKHEAYDLYALSGIAPDTRCTIQNISDNYPVRLYCRNSLPLDNKDYNILLPGDMVECQGAYLLSWCEIGEADLVIHDNTDDTYCKWGVIIGAGLGV